MNFLSRLPSLCGFLRRSKNIFRSLLVCGLLGLSGQCLAASGTYDVVVLDLMLPKMDGLSLLKNIRKKGVDTHVLILTAKDAVEDRIRGLDSGADDYLTKPFSIDELIPRVAALIRRSYGQKDPELGIGNLLVDLNRREVYVEDEALPLAPREYRLLEFLCLRANELVTRIEIEAHLYEDASERFSNVIDSTISILRRKMSEAGCGPKITTRRGQGYILENLSQ